MKAKWGKGIANALALAALAVPGMALAKQRLPASVALSATLSGSEVTPGPGDPDGTGMFSGTLARDTGELCYDLQVHNIHFASAVRIHVGREGRADLALASLGLPDAEGKVSGCVTIQPRLTKHLIMLPEHYYVSVYNVNFPNGAIRGQLGSTATQ